MRKVLIANRGEIAVRIARACRDAGLASVAVYAAQDRDALHVRTADEAVPLGGVTPEETYLDRARLLQAAADSGADALHPGYGYLAENGFPLVVKAASGGGGSGLTVARAAAEIPDAYARAVRAAAAAGRPPACFAERYLDQARHVETQCLAHRYGNVFSASVYEGENVQDAVGDPAAHLPGGDRQEDQHDAGSLVS